MKRLFLTTTLFITLFNPLCPVWAAAKEEAQAIIKNTIDQVLKAPDKLNDPAWVDNLVDQVFDFQRMSKFVLGQHWKAATPAQQSAFVVQFRTLLVRTYATSLKKAIAAGVKFEVSYLPPAGDDKRPKIRTVVKQSDKNPITVDYDLYHITQVWKVYNVTVEGISLVTNYQNEFDNDILTMGMDGLIKKLTDQNQKKSETTAPK